MLTQTLGRVRARKQTGIIRLSDLTGGENSISPILNMNPKFSNLMQNCLVSERGTIAKIPGYVKVNTNSCGQTLTNGFEFRKIDGTVVILSSGGGKIFSGVGASLTEVHTGLDTSAKVRFAAMNNTCIACNGVNNPLVSSDGTTWTALSGSPPATAFKPHVHKGRVWMLERENKMLATHSSLNNPAEYTGGTSGYIDFKYVLKEGDELLDIFTYVDLLVFCFRNHIVIYSGTTPSGVGSDFAIVQLIEGAGVVGTDTIQNLGTDCAFLYDSGVKSLRQVVTTGNMNLDDISSNIDPTIRALISGAGSFASAHYPRYGWYIIKIGSSIFIYDYIHKAWGRIVGSDIQGMFSKTDGTLYLTGTNFLYQYDSGFNFAGINPTMIWESAYLPLSRRGEKAYPTMAEIVLYPHEPTALDFRYAYDVQGFTTTYQETIATMPADFYYIDDVTDWNAIDPFDSIAYDPFKIMLRGGGRTMQLRFENTSNKLVEIADITILLNRGGF